MKRSLAVLSLVLTTCTNGGYLGPPPATRTSQSTSPPAETPAVVHGGSVTFGAEQWPECVNPVTSCSAASWAHWVLFQHVLPHAMELDAQGNFVASPLLVEAPTLENGGLEPGPPFRLTLRINPEAVWDDGSAITSTDFRFTWLAFVSTTGAYGYEGYEHITSIDTTDPHVAVVRFDEVYIDWPELFGGPYSYVLEAAAFPDLDPDHPDLKNLMQKDIPFSGGPFRLVEWDQNHELLTRNPHYFGRAPLLDEVTFVPTTNPDTELQDLRSGDVSAIYPLMIYGGDTASEAFGSDPAIAVQQGSGVYFEALWLNHSIPPLDDPHVREALMYAVDRQAIVDEVVRPWNPSAEVSNCGFVASPTVGPWCATQPFERFTYDPERARHILEADGYNCDALPCSKHGKRLEITYSVVWNNERRTRTQEMVIRQASAAGFSLVARNYCSTCLFVGYEDFPIQDFAAELRADPSVTSMFDCDSFRTPRHSGTNWTNWCDHAANDLMRQADAELDPGRRLELMTLVYGLEAFDFVSLPLYVLPVTSAWRMDQIGGPIGLFNSSPNGMFFNMSDWYLVR